MTRLVSKRRCGIQADNLFEFGPGASGVINFLVGKTKVITKSLIIRSRLHRAFQEGHGDRVTAIIVVGPSERIGGIWEVWKAAVRGLGQCKGDVRAASMFEEQVGEIVGSDGILRIDGQNLLIGCLGLLPIAGPFVEGAEASCKPTSRGESSMARW